MYFIEGSQLLFVEVVVRRTASPVELASLATLVKTVKLFGSCSSVLQKIGSEK